MVRHFLKIADLSPDEIVTLIEAAKANKGERSNALAGRSVGMIFAKPSTRTRVSFTVGAYQLGGHIMFISENEMQLGRGETIEDTARVLSGYLNGVVIRTYRQEDIESFARVATIPVINGLTDDRHPCQAVSDLMTISEYRSDLANVKVVYLGDGNNVSISLMHGCASVGADITICTPDELAPPEWSVREAEKMAQASGARVTIMSDPALAVKGADFLYTDVWFSMGQQKNPAKRAMLEPYRIDQDLLTEASPDAKVMHCLPAHRGEEISADVMDGPQSIVYQQAENRLHAQKELLKFLMGNRQQ